MQQRAVHPAKIVQARAEHPAKAGWSGKVQGMPERRAVAQTMLASKEPELAPISDLVPVPAPVSTAYSRLVAELVRDESHHEELTALMSYDHVFERSAPEQLEKCLEYWALARAKDSLELAMCLYTTYFYSVVNKSLRQDSYLDGVKSELIRDVVMSTRYWLRSGFKVAAPGPIRTFRWELQSEWTKDAKAGERRVDARGGRS